jgi:hypothetical protein
MIDMRNHIFWIGVCAATALISAARADLAKEASALRLEVDLVDGSRLIGAPGIATVPVQTSYAKMDVPLTQIKALKIGEDHETVTLNLRNGDTLTGVISLKPIELKTVFGTASIGIEHIQQFRVTLGGRNNGSKWSLRNDFSTTSNPSDPWSYGWTPDGNPAFTRYASMIHKPGVDGWQVAQDAQCIWINHSVETMYGARPGEVSIHPGPNREHSVVRWQAPRSCTIIVKGTFGSGDAGAMTVRVRHNATQLFLASDTSKDEPFLFELKVQQDDTVDFDVGCGRGGSMWCGTTPIDAEIVVK